MSLLADTELTLRSRGGQVWKPKNFDEREHGHVFLHEALARSYNLATVRLGMELGLRSVIGTLEALGIEREIAPLPALLLGAISLTPFEVAQMYQTIAAGGFRTPLRAIREVFTTDGEPLQRYPVEVRQVVDPAAVYLLTRNLVEVVRAGTGRGLARYLGTEIDIAGKTGTTNELRDSWFAGFSNELVGVVWLGRDDNRAMGLTGSAGALPVWGRLMRRLEASSLQRTAPENIEYLWVNPRTGLLADERCEGAAAFPFIRGSAPTVRDECVSATEAQRSGGFLQRWLR
jgi:penicillin-binding protein 1B